MEGTSCGDDCCYVKNGLCKKVEECPNYTESIWKENTTGKVTVVKDCSPKRTMLCQQQTINSFDHVTSSVQVLKSKIERLEDMMLNLIQKSQKFMKEKDTQAKRVEYDQEK